jgi:hypothetical protein
MFEAELIPGLLHVDSHNSPRPCEIGSTFTHSRACRGASSTFLIAESGIIRMALAEAEIGLKSIFRS